MNQLHCTLLLLCAAALSSPMGAVETFQQVVVNNGAQTTVSIRLSASTTDKMVVRAIIADCACIQTTTNLPLSIPSGEKASIQLIVRGGVPGMKTVEILTSAGRSRHAIQILHSPQQDTAHKALAGSARQEVTKALRNISPQEYDILLIAHDLKSGEPQDCPCAEGQLGDVRRIIALDNLVQQLTGQLAIRLATGSVSRDPDSLVNVLWEHGWVRSHEGVVVSQRPLAAAQAHPQSLIIDGSPENKRYTGQHARIISPLLSHGGTVSLVIINKKTSQVRHWIIPIDQSLDRDE